MKQLFLFLSFILCFYVAKAQTIKIKKQPNTIEEFIKLRDKIAITPQGGASIMLLALKIYAEDEELGKKCIVVAVDRSRLVEGNVYKNYKLSTNDMDLISRMTGKYKNIFNSYIKGSSPKNAYQTKLPYVYEYSASPYSGEQTTGKYKLFVKCSGADSSRSITIKKNNKGIWKSSSWSSILTGVKKTKKITDDDL